MIGYFCQYIICRRPRHVLIFAATAIILVLLGGLKIKYIGDIDASLPSHSRATDDFKIIRSLFGGNDTVAFSIRGADRDKQLAASCDLAKALNRHPQVVSNTVLGLGSSATELLRDKEGALTVVPADSLCGRKTPDAAALSGTKNRLVAHYRHSN